MKWILEGKNPNGNDCTNNESNEIELQTNQFEKRLKRNTTKTISICSINIQ
mgnify:CR=1 FL=1